MAVFLNADHDKCDPSVPQRNDSDEDQCDPSDYTKCDSMKRLTSSSHIYSMLQTKKSENYDEIFTRFMNDMYNGKGKGLIDDYIHFRQHHEHQLERITRELSDTKFGDCSILDCEYTRRHMADPRTSCTETSDAKLQFYCDTFDAVHFHLFHCFEAGLRVIMRDDNDEMEEEKEKATNDE
eukprot:244590_1